MPLHEQCQRTRRIHNPGSSNSGTRSLMATTVALLLCTTSQGMVVTSPGVRSAKATNNAQALLNQARALHEQRSDKKAATSSNVNILLDEETYSKKMNWAEALFDDMMNPHLESAIEELQMATGSEIPDQTLQNQIDQATIHQNPRAFLNAHEPSATQLEQVAMASIPQQLPRPALQALNNNKKTASKAKKQVSLKKKTLVKKKKKKVATKTSPKSSSVLRLRNEAKATTAAAASTTANSQKKPKKWNKTNSHLSDLNFSKQRVTPEEEIELATQIQKGVALHKLKTDYEAKNNCEITKKEWTALAQLSSPTELRKQVLRYRQAKQLLVEANMGLVHAVVKAQYSHGGSQKQARGISKEELIQEGSLGLLRAAELFDPSKGLRFSTYATIWIKGMLSNTHVDETITLPQREKTKWNKICKAHDDIVAENGGDEDVVVGNNKSNKNNKKKGIANMEEQIAKRVGMSVEQVFQMKRKMTQVNSLLSLDYEYKSTQRSGGVDPNGAGYSKLEMTNSASFAIDVDIAEQTELRADVVAALAQNLDAREARLMRLRYGLADGQTRTISQCAEAMGLSQSRVKQLATQCLKKLRQAQNAESLQEYLLTIA
jgi:RNA polymerase primary sigma factor